MPQVTTEWSAKATSFDCLFVGGLPPGTTAEELRSAFERQGSDVAWVELVRDRWTGRCRGFAFVELRSPRALERLASVTIDGHPLSIKGMPKVRRRHAL